MRDFSGDILALKKRLGEASSYLRIEEGRQRSSQLEAEASRPDLWDDPEEARRVTSELSDLTDDITLVDELAGSIEDAETLFEMGKEEGDDSLESEIEDVVGGLKAKFEELELRSLFSSEFDERDAVCDINSGAGGVDAQDWAEMMLRMYQRWANKKGFTLQMQEVTEGTEAGISSCTFSVKGRYAFGMLKAEQGVHRLVRISPFDAQARRHTAFSSFNVVPEFDEVDDDIVVDEGDLRIDTYRSSGAGGQHVNVTDSAVRITHLPTGIVVACQNERSQHQNKDRAMTFLKAKLLALRIQERAAEVTAMRGDQMEVGWGSQIRSYVLQPYQQVKDLRSGHEIGNVDAVLDGDLDGLIEAYLRWVREEALTDDE